MPFLPKTWTAKSTERLWEWWLRVEQASSSLQCSVGRARARPHHGGLCPTAHRLWRAGQTTRLLDCIGIGYAGGLPVLTRSCRACIKGLSLHANTYVPAHQRDQLERVMRSTARGSPNGGWPHFNGATSLRTWKRHGIDDKGFDIAASMEPRPCERGNVLSPLPSSRVLPLLQWSHVLANVETRPCA
jgi:hypothetical protein